MKNLLIIVALFFGLSAQAEAQLLTITRVGEVRFANYDYNRFEIECDPLSPDHLPVVTLQTYKTVFINPWTGQHLNAWVEFSALTFDPTEDIEENRIYELGPVPAEGNPNYHAHFNGFRTTGIYNYRAKIMYGGDEWVYWSHPTREDD